jgi:NAD+ synthetase
MTLANHYNALVFTTGNKSEIATGYCTMYGDMCGALAPIGDVLKTRVYDVAHRLNEWAKREGGLPPIPESSMTKAPSAELRPDQKDEDSLPPYEKLDPMLADYLEVGLPVSEVLARHGAWVPEILRKIEMNEYKRRQGAPVLKVSAKAFGVGRRVPIAKVWDRNI